MPPMRDDVTMRWQPDILEGFEQTTLTLPPAYDGAVEVVLVRKRSASPRHAAVLYVHGFVDYFFQTHLAEFFCEQGVHFYAIDLRRHGRSLRPHQRPNEIRAIDEFLEDLDAAIAVIEAEESPRWLLLNGHSTGGLVAALYAQRGQRRHAVNALFLNSPFLEMNLPAWQKRVLVPLAVFLGGIWPQLRLPRLPTLYGESLHREKRGHWNFDRAWKPVEGFPVFAGWFRAIRRAQAAVARAPQLTIPILVLHAARSLRPRQWSEAIREADVVLNVADIARVAPTLGSNVVVHPIAGAIHDLMLSRDEPRARALSLLGEWMQPLLPPKK